MAVVAQGLANSPLDLGEECRLLVPDRYLEIVCAVFAIRPNYPVMLVNLDGVTLSEEGLKHVLKQSFAVGPNPKEKLVVSRTADQVMVANYDDVTQSDEVT